LQQQKKAAQSSSSCRHINQLNVFYWLKYFYLNLFYRC
jgi:hypothetical protein